MNRISTVAFAAALLGAGGLAAAPAAAKEKPQAQVPGMKLSPELLKVAQPAQVAITAKDYATAEPLVAQTEAVAKTDQEKYVAAALRYDLENGKLYAGQDANPKAPINETALAGPLDTLIANPATPTADRPRYVFRRGVLAFNGKQYPQAIRYFQQAKQLGYTDGDIDLQIIKAKMESGDVAGGSADLSATIDRMNAAGQKAPEAYYRYAIAHSNTSKDKTATMGWLSRWAVAYPTPKNWRDIVVFYGLQQQPVEMLDNAEKLDLYRLLHDTHSLSDQIIYEEYADSASKRGLPSEAANVLREGQASGKLSAAMVAAPLAKATRDARAEGSLASLDTRSRAAADGKLASQTADGHLSQGENAKAADLYRVALSKGGVDADEVNTHLGIALARTGDKAGAQAAFAAVKGMPRAHIAALWTTWLTSESRLIACAIAGGEGGGRDAAPLLVRVTRPGGGCRKPAWRCGWSGRS